MQWTFPPAEATPPIKDADLSPIRRPVEADEVRGSLSAYALRPGDVIVIEVDRDISMPTADRIKANVTERFPGHEVLIVVGRFRAFRPVA